MLRKYARSTLLNFICSEDFVIESELCARFGVSERGIPLYDLKPLNYIASTLNSYNSNFTA